MVSDVRLSVTILTLKKGAKDTVMGSKEESLPESHQKILHV